MTASAGKATLARNTVYAVMGHAVALAVPLLVTPYIVNRIGMELYGIWAALNVMVLLLSQYDFGIWNAIARETAIRKARNDREGLRSLLATCFTYDMVVAPVLFVLVLLAGRPIRAPLPAPSAVLA